MAHSPKIQKRQEARKAQILEHVRGNPDASRASIQKATRMSMESTLTLVDALIEQGLLLECGKVDTQAGRKPVLLRINPEGSYSVGLRFNAGRVTGVVIDFAYRVRFTRQLSLPPGVDAGQMVAALEACVASLLSQLGPGRDRVAGIGVGAPGIIDLERGVAKRYIHIRDWSDVPLRALLQRRFQLPVFVEHGVKCTARAMQTLPRYAPYKNMALVQMGRGINMCLIMNGQIYQGDSGISSEIGHIRVTEEDRVCACGRKGCLETVASSAELLRAIREGQAEDRFQALPRTLEARGPLPLASLLEGGRRQDPDCVQLLRRTGAYIGRALSFVVTLLNPGCILFSGELSESEDFRQALEQTLQAESLRECLDAVFLAFEPSDETFDAFGAAQVSYARRARLQDVL